MPTNTVAIHVFRNAATGTKPAGVNTPGILPCPAGFQYLRLFAKGTGAASCKIEGTTATGDEIAADTATWVQVDATLDSVGTTEVAYDLGSKIFTCFRVTALTNDQTATLVILGR